MLCGSSANENVFKAAMFAYRAKQRAKAGRGPTDFTRDELESCMVNQSPGCANDLSILSFRGGFHGRTMATISATAQPKYHGPEACWKVPDLFENFDFNDAASAEQAFRDHDVGPHFTG